MVVALDADGGGDAVAHIDHAGVLTGPHEYPLGLAGQPPEMDARGLVGAVLGPHDGVHRQFQVVRLAPQDLLDLQGFLVGEPEGAVDGLVGLRARVNGTGHGEDRTAWLHRPRQCPWTVVATSDHIADIRNK
jgi:hypothetical protein